MEFVKRNGLEDKIDAESVAQKWYLIDHHLQQIKANRADEDLKKALKLVFNYEIRNNKDKK